MKVTLLTWIYGNVISNIQKSLGRSASCFLDSIVDHNINISKCNFLAVSSYTKLPNKLEHPRKDLLNIEDTDGSECFKYCLAIYIQQIITRQELQKLTKTFKKTWFSRHKSSSKNEIHSQNWKKVFYWH